VVSAVGVLLLRVFKLKPTGGLFYRCKIKDISNTHSFSVVQSVGSYD